jgi:hypothetical protein
VAPLNERLSYLLPVVEVNEAYETNQILMPTADTRKRAESNSPVILSWLPDCSPRQPHSMLMEYLNYSIFVIPANAGIQKTQPHGFRLPPE